MLGQSLEHDDSDMDHWASRRHEREAGRDLSQEHLVRMFMDSLPYFHLIAAGR